MKILVVCSGNICRSPMAVAVLSDRLRRKGLLGAVEVSSAGTLGIEGEPADSFAVEVCAAAGYDISRHRSAAFTEDSAASSDLILVMEEQHARAARAAAPRAEVSLLGAFLPSSLRLEGAGEIADPVGGDLEAFEECLSLIERAVEGLMASRQWPARSDSAGEEAEDPEVAYFRAAEEKVIEARKGGRGLTSMEFHVIDGWWKRRLPLWLVLEAAGEAALDWPPGEAPRGFIRRLEREVEARAREAGFEPPAGSQVALDSKDESRIRRAIARELLAAARKQAQAHPAL
ncbi:MAG TPA: low molecular weight protein-tyrosine-phosphatase, partial [Candidatus Saccharimonadales bacterium]|nr:low molecular weight protein-tyrosine-phosphatase [Candidatus Saccharimonadales bacterium]